MSDKVITIYPEKLGEVPEAQWSDDLIGSTIRDCNPGYEWDDIVCAQTSHVRFFDSGQALSTIVCTACGKLHRIHRSSKAFGVWWSAFSDEWLGETEIDFSDYAVSLPCCGREQLFRNLTFTAPCAFGRFSIEIWSPSKNGKYLPLSFTLPAVKPLEDLLGLKLLQISSLV